MRFIRFPCPVCGKDLQVPADKAGAQGKCRHCGALLRVPNAKPPGDPAQAGVSGSAELVRLSTPEEVELEKKRAELAQIESVLAEKELELATLKAEMSAFEREYLSIVGVKYGELDAIEAETAELLARRNPNDAHSQQKAREARERAEDSARAASEALTEERGKAFAPSDELKKLYREIAKRVHPDLADSGEERLRRNKVMAEVNEAYAVGDEARLRAILREWQSRPEAVEGEGPAAELVRCIRKIARAEERMRAIEAEIDELGVSELYQLRRKVQQARREGRDLLAAMAADLTGRIAHAQRRLQEVRTVAR